MKSLQRAKGRAQGARPLLRPLPDPLLACGQRGPRGGGGAVGSRRWALLWAALASTGDHLLAVNASPARLGCRPGNGGRGRLRSVCVLVWVLAVGAGAGHSSVSSTLGLVKPMEGWGVTTTRSDRALLFAAPCPLPRATPTRGSWSL